ncbi:MAG: hypothetical protein Q4A66_05370 [Eubacteriales bacterium]|nr:hypothetical protein [Eubacteriales bacterium]
MKKLVSVLSLCLALCLCLGCVSFADVNYICPTNGQTYPISEEKIDVELWYPMAGSMAELADFNEAEFFIMYEELTNMHVDFIVPASGTEGDSFQLLFASDDMPDMAYHGTGHAYRDGEDAAIEDGYFVNMVDYLDIAPNYKVWLDTYPEFNKAAYTDSGRMYGMWAIWLTMGDQFMADQGLAIRKDFLDKVDMDLPVTYEDWYNILVAFRDELGIEAPFYTSKYGIDPTGEFMAGYGVGPYFYQDNGEVKFGPMEDGYRDYLEMLHKWWEEGLLDKNFATRSSSGITADNDMQLNDKVGSLIDYGTRLAGTYVTRGAGNEDFFLVAVQQPVLKEGDVPAYRQYSAGNDRMNGNVMVFDAEGDHIEECIRWNDGFYAADIYLQANFGLDEQEGVVWYADEEDGHRIGNYAFRYSNPNGTSSAMVLVKYWTKNPPVRVESAQIEQCPEPEKRECYEIWSKYEPTQWISTRVTMTVDEGAEFATLYTDIETYVQECNVKFIMGQMDLAEYDAYRAQLESMNIDRCIELKQAALDRYNAR